MPAFGRYEKKGVEKKAPIDDIPQWQKVFEQVMAEDLAATKKPVRWNFLKDSEGLLTYVGSRSKNGYGSILS